MQQTRGGPLVKRAAPLILALLLPLLLLLAASLLLLRMPPAMGDNGPLHSSKSSASAVAFDPDKPVAATRPAGGKTTMLFIGINTPRNLSEAHAACRKAGGQLASVGAAQQGLQQHLQAALLNLTHLQLLQRAERQYGIAASVSNLTTDTLLAEFCYNGQERSFATTGRDPMPQEGAARRVPLRPNVPVLWWMHDKDAKEATESSDGQDCQAWAVAEGGWMARLDCDTRLPFVCQVEEPEPAEYRHPDMPGLVALARHALPPAAITNRSFDPCCPSSSSTEKAGWHRWQSASALFKCNTAGRVSMLDLQPWHLTTTGSMLEGDYTTSSAWTARTLDQLQQLSVRLYSFQAWESEDHWLDKFRACRPGSGPTLFQPATPICTQQLASLAPALQRLETGRNSEELQRLIQDPEASSQWGFAYWPHGLRPASYSWMFGAGPEPDRGFAHTLQSFPQGLKPLCGLRQLRVLRVFPVTAVADMAAKHPRNWLERATRSHASQPEVDKAAAAAAAAGAASVTGADLLPACLADLSELTVLELSHTTTTPMQLPAEWGGLRKLKALSITHNDKCRDESLASGRSDQSAAPTITLPNGTTTTLYGCGLALPPTNYKTSTRAPCAEAQFLACVYAQWRHSCQCAGPRAAAVSGTLPAEWGKLASLRDLSLPFHRLSGPLPASWAAGMVSLERLRLEGNALSGDLAPWVSATKAGGSPFPALRELLIGCNNISGPLPDRLDSLARLQLLRLDANGLSSDLSGAPLQLPPGLQMLSLQHNNLSGSLPCFQGPSSPSEPGGHQLSLQVVNLADNRLSGTLPPCYKAGSPGSTPNLTLLDLSHQRADPAAVQAAFAAALQQAAAPPECKRMASTTACRDVQATAAAAALSNLSIHGPVPASLMTIKQLVLTGLSLSGPLPEAAVDAIRAATLASKRWRNSLALRDWHREDRRMQLTASQQLSGGFDPVIPASLLPGGCDDVLVEKGDQRSVQASFKLGHAGSLSVRFKDGSAEELHPPLQQGAFSPDLSLSTQDSAWADDYFWGPIEEYSDDEADFQLHGFGAQSEPAPPAAIYCANTPAGALANELVQGRRRQASSSYSQLHQETTHIAADHQAAAWWSAVLARIDSLAVWNPGLLSSLSLKVKATKWEIAAAGSGCTC